jgi:uncharacterized membrane protein
MSEILAVASLLAATITVGLMAGLYYAFTISVMPGLARAGDEVFVAAMWQINRAILNGWFAIGFGGSAVLAAIAAVLHLGDPSLPWIIAALVLYVSTLVITFSVNVPLNNALDASGDPARSPDVPAVRAAFEARWVRWNTVRTLVCVLALGCLAWALLVRGAP